MSATGKNTAWTPPRVAKSKGEEPLVCLTAYTTPMARLVDAHCDVVLVGDSVGMVLHGLPSTLGVTLDMMIMHGRAVRRGVDRALMVVDMPFGSYEEGPEQAFRNASRIMAETGCAAVKLEGGEPIAETIRFLSARGVPVMAHVGLTPQAINIFGGYAVQGRGEEGEHITDRIAVPTIGIGASPACDGQILVVDDMLGAFTDFRPKFVKRFAELGAEAEKAIAAYAADVRERRFPAAEHVFDDMPDGSAKGGSA